MVHRGWASSKRTAPMPAVSAPSETDEFVAAVIGWYERYGRHELPWRAADASPYEVLVAEVMLQKTSAEQVLGVFEAFIEQYPDPAALADASEEEIDREIQELGLRKRAGHLVDTAKRIDETHAGSVPMNRADLLDLTGVGEYTAASVLAHAHGEDIAAVDTNVARILSRAFGSDEEREEGTQELAEEIVPAGRGSDFVHALIDLGSAICTPSTPDCEECPVSNACDYAADRGD